MANDQKIDLYDHFREINTIDASKYKKYDVKRGLRNDDGTGVLAGLTGISNVHGYVMSDGEKVADTGELRLRGYDLYDLLGVDAKDRRFNYEEVSYLLLMGELPTQQQLDDYIAAIDAQRELPDGFTASMIMRDTPPDIMNVLARTVMLLYAYDTHAEDRSAQHEISTAISLISRLPRIMVLTYYAMRARYSNDSMIMHRFIPGQSTAETILSMLRPDRQFRPEEARMLDIMLCLHAEHGGGNNSTFTCRSVSSTGTDTYSAIAAAVGSLKGPKHGGANRQVLAQFSLIKQTVRDWKDDDAVADCVGRILRRELGDGSGLIYGMGHAVYTLSDPRTVILRQSARTLAAQRGMLDELELMEAVERVTPRVFAEITGHEKVMCANVDMYSGLIYQMLDIPPDLFTPLFAVARITGWCAHRMEEVLTGGRLYRPAYKSLTRHREYIPMAARTYRKNPLPAEKRD